MEIKPLHIGLGIVGLGALYLLLRPEPAVTIVPMPLPVPGAPPPPPPPPSPTPVVTGKSYDSARAFPVVLSVPSGALTTGVGASILAANTLGNQLWVSPGVTSSNTTVLTPSDPATTNGFVAIAPGTAILTGYIWDDTVSKNIPITATVVVVASSGAAVPVPVPV